MRLFSAIIPLYNRPQEIDELLESLTHQTYTYFEVLVIEDGSTNDAREIVAKYNDRLNLHYFFKPNEGQGFTRNFGFKQAIGDYFVIFDSDCLIPKDYFETVNNYLDTHYLDCYGGPDAAHESFTLTQKAISYAMTSPFTTGGIRGNKKHIGQFHPRSFNMGLSREVYEKVGGFILTRLGEDIEYSIRIQEHGFKIGLIPDAKVYHKRRTNFKQFYKQLHFFGRARINIYKHFPKELKMVHFFPAMFVFFLLLTVFMNIFLTKYAHYANGLLLLYVALLSLHSFWVTSSLRVTFLSICAAFIQLIAYGLGFMQDYLKKVVLKRS